MDIFFKIHFEIFSPFLSVENPRIDVEKCGNEHSEQMLMLLALLQDNRSLVGGGR